LHNKIEADGTEKIQFPSAFIFLFFKQAEKTKKKEEFFPKRY